MSDFDVAIIGAGPAGSWAAYKLARRGARVALVDGTHPREKPCGGGVTARAFEIVRGAVEPVRVAAVPVRTVIFGERDGTAAVSLEEEAALLVAARCHFDGALRDAAIRAGAHAIDARVRDLEAGTSGWSIRLGQACLSAAWVYGADGTNSLVRRRVARPFHRAELSIATGYYVPTSGVSEIRIAFEANPPGYLWSFPRRDHLAVGVCAQADRSDSASLLRRAGAWIDSELTPRGSRQRYSWPIPSLDERSLRTAPLAGRRWMLLGDAAGVVDPITREGIYFALLSADAAAESVLHDRDPAAAYEGRMRQSVLDELIRAARLKAAFFRPQFTSLLIEALRRSGAVRRVMADLIAGRQTYRGLRRRLLATCEIGLMLKLLRA